MDLTNNSNKTLVFITLYFSLLVGFYFGENSSGGAYPDFLMRINLIENFSNDFNNTFLNYHKFSDRHSPIFIIMISYLNYLGIDLDIIRLINLNTLPLLILVSYKCLNLKFPTQNKNLLFFFSCVFFLSPTLRSISVWPDSRLIGFLLFFCSVYFFLKFKTTEEFKYCIYSNLLLIICSYISPNFSVFIIYYFFYYIKIIKNYNKITLIFLINAILSLPIFYYLFVLKVNFLTVQAAGTSTIFDSINIANKVFVISSLIFFYMMPFAINNYFIKNLIRNFKIKDLYASVIIFLILIVFFNYSPTYTGGGIFFNLSYFIFENDYFFLVITFASILLIFNVFDKNLNNLLLFIILVLSNPQLTIYHKYYDPLLILLFFLFFEFKIDIRKIINYKLIISIYLFYLIFLVLNFARNLI
tara:strand:+ start:4099 stop:5340 length:1242 start_codon:yes stop_codon:yes gene_type:complete